MYPYVEPITEAFRFFPLIAAVIAVPLMIAHWRRYGAVQSWRSAVLYSFILYYVTAYFLVILPLPELTEDFCARFASLSRPQLSPFRFVRDIAIVFRSLGGTVDRIGALVRTRVFIQVVFNFLLLLPLGFYLRYLFRLRFISALTVIFLTTLFFEITQLTGLYGIYPCPYRIFDVDDLFVNTFGGVVGYAMVPAFRGVLPALTPRYSIVASRVSLVRRGVAFFLDIAVASIVFAPIRPFVLSTFGPDGVILARWLVQSLVFVVAPALFRGMTPGGRVVLLRIVAARHEFARPLRPGWPIVSAPAGTGRLIVRFIVLLVVPIALDRWILAPSLFEVWFGDRAILAEVVLVIAMAAAYVFPPVFRRDHRFVHDLVSGSRVEAVVPVKE